jgi:hypothetical protein
MTALWACTLALEAGLLVLANRINNSWILLVGLALVLIPIAAADMTLRWFGREPRKRWKRHELKDALTAAVRSSGPPGRRSRRGGPPAP